MFIHRLWHCETFVLGHDNFSLDILYYFYIIVNCGRCLVPYFQSYALLVHYICYMLVYFVSLVCYLVGYITLIAYSFHMFVLMHDNIKIIGLYRLVDYRLLHGLFRSYLFEIYFCYLCIYIYYNIVGALFARFFQQLVWYWYKQKKFLR